MAFVNHIIPRGKRDFSKINLWRDTSHCILYVKLQSLWDTPKYNAIIKILCTDFFIMIGTTSKGGTVKLVTFIFLPLAKGHPNIYIYVCVCVSFRQTSLITSQCSLRVLYKFLHTFAYAC